ncbi:hypothetical protein EV426DRAFT_198480 [Tirmania nivea]|nr:hypothetical protein EV426DRAFT_198480 [Tirmania nivea]
MNSEKRQYEQNAEAGTRIPFTKVINHLKTFPVVSDSLCAVQQHPIGQRSISITSTAYDKFLRPFTPYFVKVNEYASPYVSKADEIADQGLGKVEATFPILKEPTENVKSKVTEQLQSPRKIAGNLYGTGLSLANEKKDYVFKVYHDELAKDGNKGYLPAAKAGITTSFVVAADGIQWVYDTLSKKAPTTEKTNEAST